MFAVQWGDEHDDCVGAVFRERVSGSDVRGLSALFAELDAERRRVEARLAVVVGEVDRRGLYAVDGHATAKGWCRASAKWSTPEAVSSIRVARLMHASAEVADAALSGAIGVSQLRLLARAFANPRCGAQLLDVITLLVEHAQQLSFDDFALVMRRWEMLADTDGAHRNAEAVHRDRQASMSEHDGVFDVHAQGGVAQGVAIQEIFQRYVDAEFAIDWAETVAVHGDDACAALMPRTPAQRRYDAFHKIFLDAVSTPAGAQAPDPVVNIITTLDVIEEAIRASAGDGGDGGDADDSGRARQSHDPRWWRAETINGVPVPPQDILAAALIGHVRRVVVDSAGVIIDLGRKRRLFTGSQRDAVLMGSSRCIWPGCDQPSGRCQADHINEWQHDGVTNIANAAPLCPRHNRWKARGYTVTRDAHGYWHTAQPDGTRSDDLACADRRAFTR